MMHLFDTASCQLREFCPPDNVGMYVCGITPYDSAHLGHILTFLTYDLLQRRLEDCGRSVRMIRNVTDVDEPIYVRAAELGIPYTELAETETAKFQETMRQLNFRPAAAEPKASQFVSEIAEAVERLLQDKFAYRIGNDVYFDVARYPAYGGFSKFGPVLLDRISPSRGGDPDRPGKRQPLDFLLWKDVPDTADPAGWETGLGRGRPGWHMECTLMSHDLLGMPFDLHGGGSDLIFPHHESELAQAHGLGYGQVARHWLHVSPVLWRGEKMSKSLGNLVFAHDLLDKHEASVVRLAIMNYHYRVGGEWQPAWLESATGLLARLRYFLPKTRPVMLDGLLAEIRLALDTDLDAHEVVHILERFAATSDEPGNQSATETSPRQLQTLNQLLGLDI